MGKIRMPTFNECIEKKIIYGPKREPVWVYIEKEMRINITRKPYNEKVGRWLKFLRDLKHYYYCESQRQLRILLREVGPSWYVELATNQKEILGYLSMNIKKDLFEDMPSRTRKSLSDLGITYRIPNKVLLNAMSTCMEDPGIFIWNLYSAIYKQSPSELRGEYDMNSMILMSSLVAIDLKECIECLEKLTAVTKKRIAIRETKKTRYFEPDVKYGVYLQKMYAPFYCNHPPPGQPKPLPPPIECKIRIRSQEGYERLCLDTKFLKMRLERNRKQLAPDRVCNYKFWEAPSWLRNSSQQMVDYAIKKKMLKLRPKVNHLGPYNHVQYCVGPVSYVRSRPRYMLNSVCYLPTGYIPINGGLVYLSSGETCLVIAGYWIKERETRTKCDSTCSCVEKWETAVMNYVRDQKCMCRHLYDYRWSGKAPEKYFYPPTRHRQYFLDKAKIYQDDPMEDFIKHTVEDAVQSGEATPSPSSPSVNPSALKESELLAAFLADLSKTPLIIPHLPEANRLNNLKEWVRRRVKGRCTPDVNKQMLLRSMRRWLWLKNMDFRMRAYRIPFTQKQLQRMDWTHRPLLNKLFNVLLNNFVMRNRMRQVEQTRLWWSTMKFDMYSAPRAFFDVYFTYMPVRMMDTFPINPYNSVLTPKYGAKTCSLNLFIAPGNS